MEYQINE